LSVEVRRCIVVVAKDGIVVRRKQGVDRTHIKVWRDERSARGAREASREPSMVNVGDVVGVILS